jgi:hypothetical protein
MPKNDEIDESATRLTKAERGVVSGMIEAETLEAVARAFKVAPQTLRSVAGGLPGHRGTLVMIRTALGAAKKRRS